MDFKVNFMEGGRVIIDGFKSPWNNRELWCSNLDINFIKRVLGNNINTIIEFGSYDGGDGIKYKYNFPLANVYSIEPSPSCYEKIKPLEKYGLRVFNYAISDSDLIMDFYQTYDHNAKNFAPCGSLNKLYCSVCQGNQRPLEIFEPIKVNARKLKTFCDEQNIPNIDLLHIDVEGHAREVIIGMENLKPRMIYIEVKSDTHNHSNYINILLTKKNFKKIWAHGSDEVWIPN